MTDFRIQAKLRKANPSKVHSKISSKIETYNHKERYCLLHYTNNTCSFELTLKNRQTHSSEQSLTKEDKGGHVINIERTQ